jgi:hypothetical protein
VTSTTVETAFGWLAPPITRKTVARATIPKSLASSHALICLLAGFLSLSYKHGMNIWRMKMRDRTRGTDMFPECHKRGIASMTHPPIFNVDLREMQKRDVPLEVKTTARSSIRHFAWDIVGGDTILVGDSDTHCIIARG